MAAGRPVTVTGIAFDGGTGIAKVEVSADGGRRWVDARLETALSRYSFRRFAVEVTLPAGVHGLMARATSTAGETQPMEARWNPAGYMRNVVETVTVTAA